MDFFEINPVMKNNTGELIKGLFEGNAEAVESKLDALLMKYVSIRDFAANGSKENYYRGFMNGLQVNGISYMEEHKSDTEAGDGCADIIASSKNDDTIVIMELKQTARPFGTKVSVAVNALEQVLEKRYADEFVNAPGIKNVYAYGICFYKKTVPLRFRNSNSRSTERKLPK